MDIMRSVETHFIVEFNLIFLQWASLLSILGYFDVLTVWNWQFIYFFGRRLLLLVYNNQNCYGAF